MRESRVDVSYFHVTSPMAPSQTRSKAWRRLEGIGGAGIGEVWLLEILVLLLCSCDRVCLGNNSSRNADGAVYIVYFNTRQLSCCVDKCHPVCLILRRDRFQRGSLLATEI